ncbi:hypothetical protein [Kribbella deserti]|uniref:Uncharacterized protein n=1 Tax=Kribbella deserti TaxID=1926257 RepID=A0ABV6QFT3_9ACTN
MWLLVVGLEPAALVWLPVWLGGAVLVDDLVIVPVVFLVGWVLNRRLGGSAALGFVRTGLLYGGLTSLIAIALLLRQGKGANPTVLPRDYVRDWFLLEATIALSAVIAYRLHRRRRGPRPDGQ